LTPPRTNLDPADPGVEVKKNENEASSTSFSSISLWKNGVTPLTEIAGKAIPRIPSNLEAKNESPLSLVDSPKVIGTLTPSTETTSLLINPETPPDPYLISKVVAFLEKVEDFDDL
jgi:hypothetical protein